MPSHNPIPLATDNVQCIKCSKPISENQSYLQCDTCIHYIHSSCINSKKSKKQSIPNNRQFTCNKCSQCPICVRKVAINHKAILCDFCNSWVHIQCNKSTNNYELFQQNPNLNFTCLQCTNSIVPYYPQVTHLDTCFMCAWFCPIHGHCWGFHLIEGSEGRKDPSASLYTHLEYAPKKALYDFGCGYEDYELDREAGYYARTQFFHDDFHGYRHNCGIKHFYLWAVQIFSSYH